MNTYEKKTKKIRKTNEWPASARADEVRDMRTAVNQKVTGILSSLLDSYVAYIAAYELRCGAGGLGNYFKTETFLLCILLYFSNI